MADPMTPELMAASLMLKLHIGEDGVNGMVVMRGELVAALRFAYENGKRDGCSGCIEFVRGYTVAERPLSELADALHQAAAIRFASQEAANNG